jgi:hypothetical protein
MRQYSDFPEPPQTVPSSRENNFLCEAGLLVAGTHPREAARPAFQVHHIALTRTRTAASIRIPRHRDSVPAASFVRSRNDRAAPKRARGRWRAAASATAFDMAGSILASIRTAPASTPAFDTAGSIPASASTAAGARPASTWALTWRDRTRSATTAAASAAALDMAGSIPAHGPRLSVGGEVGGLGNDFKVWSVRGRAFVPF